MPDELYDFAEPEPVAKPRIAKPGQSAGAPVLAYRAPRDDKPELDDTQQIKDVYLPLGLLGGGVLIELLVAAIWPHRTSHAMWEMTLDLTVGTAILLGAMNIAARIRHIDLGKTGVAAYKLAAVGIAPVAIMEFLTPVLNFIPLLGPLAGFAIEFILFFALLGALFDLDQSDTWYCVCTILAVRIAIYSRCAWYSKLRNARPVEAPGCKCMIVTWCIWPMVRVLPHAGSTLAAHHERSDLFCGKCQKIASLLLNAGRVPPACVGTHHGPEAPCYGRQCQE